jgi:hypothetical protein
VNNGVPNQLTMFINQFQNDLWMRDDAFYAQEQWTRGKLTLQGGLRFDPRGAARAAAPAGRPHGVPADAAHLP